MSPPSSDHGRLGWIWEGTKTLSFSNEQEWMGLLLV